MKDYSGRFGADRSGAPRATAVLMVCLGNICRSPMAQGMLARAARREGLAIDADSAGTSGWHIGAAPDPRAVAVCSRRGADISRQRCRQVEAQDFADFDLILAMDVRNLDALSAIRPARPRAALGLLLDFAPPPLQGVEVPDPYFDGIAAFDRTLDMIAAGVEGLMRHLARADAAAHPR